MARTDIGSRLSVWSPIIFLLAFTVGTWPALVGIVERWTKWNEAYSHGFLVLAVCLGLTYRKLRQVRPRTGFYWPWILPLLLSVAVYAVGSLLLIEAFQQVALLPILFSGLLVQWGWRQTIPFLIPVGLIVFTIPFLDYLAWPLQLVTVAVNQLFFSQLGIDFSVEGVFVYFPGVGAFEIAHGCSGLRYLLVGLTLTFLYGELNLRHLQSRVILVAAGVALALAANWIRVFVIIYVGYASDMTSPLVNHHDTFGWWVFAGTLVPVFLIARWLEHREARRDERTDDPASRGELGAGRLRVFSGLFASSVPLLALAALFLPTSFAEGHRPVDPTHRNIQLVDGDGWMPLFSSNLAGWQPIIEQPDRRFEATYVERDGIEDSDAAQRPRYFVGLYSYDFQRPGAEVVQYGNRLYDAEHFIPDRTFSLGAAPADTLAGLSIAERGQGQPVYLAYGYYVEGRWESSELKAKLAQLPGMFNRRSDASLLVIGVTCQACDGTELLETAAPGIQSQARAYLDRVYGSRRPGG
ncbi:exosortase [Marinobacter bohaiensis]|uniref:exosortase n=1 Tax=Marinobacter bohaiensis TaxID=2201898 RepID=UPI000DAE6F00|nr:exosortase [Marinobacter bohaiensis]